MKDLKLGTVALWFLALAALCFIGWGCTHDESAGRQGIVSMDGAASQDDGGARGDGTGGATVAVDQSADTSGDGSVADAPADGQGGDRPTPGDDGPPVDSPVSDVASPDNGGAKEVGTDGAGSQDTKPDGAWSFTPGVDWCGANGGPHYVACCPPGTPDCKAKYGDRLFCDCAIMPTGRAYYCKDYQINPRTAPIPTRCYVEP